MMFFSLILCTLAVSKLKCKSWPHAKLIEPDFGEFHCLETPKQTSSLMFKIDNSKFTCRREVLSDLKGCFPERPLFTHYTSPGPNQRGLFEREWHFLHNDEFSGSCPFNFATHWRDGEIKQCYKLLALTTLEAQYVRYFEKCVSETDIRKFLCDTKANHVNDHFDMEDFRFADYRGKEIEEKGIFEGLNESKEKVTLLEDYEQWLQKRNGGIKCYHLEEDDEEDWDTPFTPTYTDFQCEACGKRKSCFTCLRKRQERVGHCTTKAGEDFDSPSFQQQLDSLRIYDQIPPEEWSTCESMMDEVPYLTPSKICTRFVSVVTHVGEMFRVYHSCATREELVQFACDSGAYSELSSSALIMEMNPPGPFIYTLAMKEFGFRGFGWYEKKKWDLTKKINFGNNKELHPSEASFEGWDHQEL